MESWKRRRWGRKASASLTTPASGEVDARKGDRNLREFVHLNQRSVLSQLASVEGSVVSAIRETTEDSRSENVVARAGAAVPGVVDLSTRGELGRATTTGSEFSRVLTIQAAVARLLNLLEGTLSLRVPGERGGAPAAQAVRPRRGDPFEARVRLRAEGIYVATAVFSTLGDLADDTPEYFGEFSAATKQGALTRALSRMLAGKVPIVAELIDYVGLEADGVVELVPLAEAAASSVSGAYFPVQLVAVLDAGDLWQDPRQVLFGDLTYTVFGRFKGDEVRADWEPLVLTPVFDAVNAALGDAMRDLRANINRTFTRTPRVGAPHEDLSAEHLEEYARKLAAMVSLDESTLLAGELHEVATRGIGVARRVGSRGSAYREVEGYIERLHGAPLDRLAAAKQRPSTAGASQAVEENLALAEPRLVEVEATAIYW